MNYALATDCAHEAGDEHAAATALAHLTAATAHAERALVCVHGWLLSRPTVQADLSNGHRCSHR
jgi:hypothetical protein